MQNKTNYLLTVSLVLSVISGLLLTTGVARAQIGSGWTSMTLGGYIDYELYDVHHQHSLTSFVDSPATMYYDTAGSSETFGLSTSSSNRVEHNTDAYYTSGSRQFQGDLQMYPGISNQCCLQIFNETNSGPIIMLQGTGANNGTLRKQSGAIDLATNCFARSLHINVIHDLNANTITVYIDGVQVYVGGGGLGSTFNLKYGLYGSFTNPTHTVWSNVKMWQGGTAAGVDPAGIYQIQNQASGMALNVSGKSKTNGAEVIQYPFGSGGTNAEWTFTPTSNGYYQLVNVNSGLDAVVQNASKSNGALIVQWAFGSSGNDQWEPVQNSDGSYTLFNLKSGLVLDDPGASLSSGIQMDQWSASSGTNQNWILIRQN